ncbi:hypothetical protein ACFQU7_33720 [Pseudoroseomonas wenyumeiae]
MRNRAAIVGWAHSPFGRLEEPDVEALMARVAGAALQHAGVEAADVDAITVGVYNNGFSRQGFEGALAGLNEPGLAHTPSTHYENACATGSAALYGALDFVESGRGRIALVIGAEKMTAIPTARTGEILLSASYAKEEADVEGGFAGIFGRIAQTYFQRYGDQSEVLAQIAAKNHRNGVDNPTRRCARTWASISARRYRTRTRWSPARCAAQTAPHLGWRRRAGDRGCRDGGGALPRRVLPRTAAGE